MLIWYVRHDTATVSALQNICLRILTGKKNRQITRQRLQKVRIWGFGSLVQQINYLEEVLKLKQNFDDETLK